MGIQLMICDDQTFTRAGIRALLDPEPDIKVMEDPGAGVDVVGFIVRRRPDVILTGALGEGARIARGLRRRAHPDKKKAGVIALVTDQEEDQVVDALLAGVSGVVRKNGPSADLACAVRAVAAGHASLTPTAARRLVDWAIQTSPPRSSPPEALASLTRAEFRVLTIIASGVSGPDAAERLGVSQATIRSHIHHVLTKLGLRSRSEAVAFAYRHGLIHR